MQLDKRTMKKIALLIGGAVFLNWFLNHIDIAKSGLGYLWKLAFPFVLGLMIAFLINIPMKKIESLIFRNKATRAKRPVSLVITFVFLIALLSFIIFLVVPQLISTIILLGKNMPQYFTQVQNFFKPYEKYIPNLQKIMGNLNLDWPGITSKLISLLQSGAGSIFTSAIGIAFSVVNFSISFIVGIMVAIYVLMDKERLESQAKGVFSAYLPAKAYAWLARFASMTNESFTQFVSGQCTEALIVSVIYTVVFSIGQFSYSLLIGVMIGFMSLIPVFGNLVASAIATLLILVAQGPWRAVVFVIIFVVINQIDANLVYPYVVGSSVGLSPLWVLFAISLGGSLMGLMGILLSIPLGSVIYKMVQQSTIDRLQKKGIPYQPSAIKSKPKKPLWQRRKKE